MRTLFLVEYGLYSFYLPQRIEVELEYKLMSTFVSIW